MTNKQIIANAQMKLAADGIIEVVNGIPEEIHTYAKWKQLGYQVLRGEKAVCKLNIWKPVTSKKKVEENGEEKEVETERMTIKSASFFARNQVEAMA